MTTMPEAQAPALNRRRVGDYVVTYLSDGVLEGSFDVFQGIAAPEAETLLKEAHRPPLPHIAIASYVVQGRGRTVLVDAGTGGFSGWGGRFPLALAAAGVAPEEVDTVLLTHAHVDHVGGLTLHGKPIFTRAEVMISETEASFWRDDANMAKAGADAKPFFDAARLALDAYAPSLKLVAAGEVLPDITLVPLPGHTPGHSGYHLRSGRDELLIWADIVHLPDVQVRKPEVTIGFDVDPDLARATRMSTLERVAAEGLVVAGMHFNMPGYIAVERHGTGYAKVDLPWTPALL